MIDAHPYRAPAEEFEEDLDESALDAHDGEPAARKRYTPVDLATASQAERNSLLGIQSPAAMLESGNIKPTRAGSMQFDLLAEALAARAVELRDSELAVRAAQKRYAEALQAFNQHVAPVVP